MTNQELYESLGQQVCSSDTAAKVSSWPDDQIYKLFELDEKLFTTRESDQIPFRKRCRELFLFIEDGEESEHA